VRSRAFQIFVSCRGGPRSKQSVALFKAIVQHAKSACTRLYAGTRMAYPPLGWVVDSVEPRIQPRVKITTEEYDGLGGHPASVAGALAEQGMSYERDAVLALGQVESFPPSLIHAIRALPPTLGATRPLHVEQCAEITPFGSSYVGRTAASSFGPLWPMPMRINVIQYCARGGPASLPPLSLTSSFDLLPTRVAMRVDRTLAVSFDAERETRRTIARRELKLTPYSFHPARDSSAEAVFEAITKQIRRIAKYEGYGFDLKDSPREAARAAGTPSPH